MRRRPARSATCRLWVTVRTAVPAERLGAAIAYWTAGGSGSGTASVAGAQSALTANQTTTLTITDENQEIVLDRLIE